MRVDWLNVLGDVQACYFSSRFMKMGRDCLILTVCEEGMLLTYEDKMYEVK